MNEADAALVYWKNFNAIASALVNDDNPVNWAIADTNATGWGPEPSGEPEIANVSDSSFDFESEILLSGDSDEDKGWAGDQLTVQVSGTFKNESGKWSLDSYEVESVANNFNDMAADE